VKLSFNKKRFQFYVWVGIAYLLIWVVSDLFNYPETYPQRFLNECWRAIYITVLNFILYEYAFPFIKFRWKRIILGIFILFVLLMLYSFGLYAWRYIGIQLHIYTALRSDASINEGVTYHFSYSVASIFFFGVIKHFYDYRNLKITAQKLQIQKQEAELNYLKSQTNPHFLFNTLNNIYSLARDKSDLAPESIMRLSKILRFMLYETSGNYIAIEQELKIINDYIALEKLRYDENLGVNFNYDVEDLKQSMPPLLLIPLVENAFKHGVSETRGLPFVDIHLSINKRQLVFSVKNSSEIVPEQGAVKENIGLSNLRRQLELLYTDYNLAVKQEASVFIATLKINLASHV
jgi:two-component system LytT family sensor kinase